MKGAATPAGDEARDAREALREAHRAEDRAEREVVFRASAYVLSIDQGDDAELVERHRKRLVAAVRATRVARSAASEAFKAAYPAEAAANAAFDAASIVAGQPGVS